MNKEVNLSITTLKVEIKVLTLDGKRFTKSVFDQLPLLEYSKYLEEGCDPIGYVYLQGRWYLFVINDVLYRANIYLWEPIVDFYEPLPMRGEMTAWQGRKDRAARVARDTLIQAMARIEASVSVKDQIFIST